MRFIVNPNMRHFCRHLFLTLFSTHFPTFFRHKTIGKCSFVWRPLSFEHIIVGNSVESNPLCGSDATSLFPVQHWRACWQHGFQAIGKDVAPAGPSCPHAHSNSRLILWVHRSLSSMRCTRIIPWQGQCHTYFVSTLGCTFKWRHRIATCHSLLWMDITA